MNKTILITGASSGIGRATAQYFLDNGWNVAATMRNPEKDDYLKGSDRLIKVKLDVTQDETIQNAIESTLKAFGKIDAILNNAGYGAIGIFEKAGLEEIKREYDVNVFGVMQVTNKILPIFRKQKSGVIINVASVAGHVGFPLFSVYNSSKFAIEGFSEGLAYELKQFNIKVKLIEPGAIKTDFYTRSPVLFKNPDITDYDEFEKTMLDYYMKAGENAPGPDIVAKKIYAAAIDKSNKIRYSIGGNAPALIFLKRFLPNRILSALIYKAMK